ncbi:MAG: hypothetical protein ACR2KT_01715 [Methylocella sp.]|nr:MAG: hypothetical protein DLM68_06050 [Hyphomicrobiales bacterium]
MFKLSTIIGAGMMLAVGTAQSSTASNYATASSISCGGYADIDPADEDSIFAYVITHGPAELGSGCNIRQFIIAECKLHPQFSVKQVIGDLFAKKKSGRKLPDIPQCGA